MAAPEDSKRLVLCAIDAVTGEAVPLRLRNGRLLVKLAAEPAATDLKSRAHRATVPADQTQILMGADSNKREKIDAPQVDADGVLQLEIVGGLGAVGSFTNHHARHQNGGADEINVAGLSGELADDQPPKAHAIVGAKHTGVVTAVGAPGSDTQIPTEQAVREAIDAHGWGMVWSFFLGAA